MRKTGLSTPALSLLAVLIVITSSCGRKGPPVWLEPGELPAPTNITARFDPDGVELAWDFPGGLEPYLNGFVVEIYAGDALLDSHVTFKRRFADSRVGPYTYRVAAIGKRKGSRGAFCTGITRPGAEGLNAPAGLRGIMTTKGFLMEWTSEGPAYEIVRVVNSPTDRMEQTIIPETPGAAFYIDRQFAPLRGEQYIYRVRAIRRLTPEGATVFVTGPWSGAFHADSAQVVPEPPRGLDITAHEGNVLIYWDVSPEKWIRGYRVYRSVDGGELAPLADTATPAYNDVPDGSGAFAYRVTALGPGDAESPMSLPVQVSLPAGNVIK